MITEMSTERPILIVDAMNLFVRSYSAYPTMSSHGYQMGGAIGFLKTLRRIIDESQPSVVYVAWEGGGSSKRRAIFSDYKKGRKPEKLNRFYGDDIPDSDENKKHQIAALLGFLKCIPACQLYASDAEADDMIAYLCRGPFRDKNKLIVSSDKDLYQLLDDKTRIYSLHKKVFVTAQNVFEEFRVTAQNFALAKALCGDVSDNIPGVKGLGFKKAAKLFPIMGLDQPVLLQELLSYSASHVDESPLYQRIVDVTQDIQRNWRLVYLDGSMMAPNQLQRVDNVLSTYTPTSDRMGFMRKLIEEGISDFNVESFYYTFNCIENLEHK